MRSSSQAIEGNQTRESLTEVLDETHHPFLRGSLPDFLRKPRDSRIDPTDPYPDVGTGNVVREETEKGVLVVTTSRVRVDQEGRLYDLPHDLDWGSSQSFPTGYAIYDQRRRFVREVPNQSSLVVS